MRFSNGATCVTLYSSDPSFIDAAEKCLAVTSEEMDRVVAKRVEATMKRRESDTATQYQAQRWGAVQVECSTWTHSLKAPGFNH